MGAAGCGSAAAAGKGGGWVEGPAEGQQECSLPAVTILQFNAMPNGKC